MTLTELRQEQDGFLVSQREIETVEDAERRVFKRWNMFLSHYLHGWFSDEKMWPQKRSLKMFKEWFDVHYHSMVWDLADEPVILEDWDGSLEE
jgi:hypothetical protein